ncbi:endonuclease/exonuclease/phosphatase family protein [Stakelama saccharophila]|uniref:Endonuclease/exonuclease/phosphatase family protein n=1 Tax=Stakelama saccharophila TaxID=3075605 RepID=A0ABZ0BBP2_9SPHN|nr:endonuclease/exonuclease/phosphatase family protein [Stakelama sp. W311]WNO54263.1 endonuclease/exonuclease/phosphatase family protein [Stakelama sp. W311]
MRILMRVVAAVGLALCSVIPAAAQAGRSDGDLRVMSFNVRYANENDGANSWSKRRDVFVDTIRKAHPDIFGTQELLQKQGDYIVDHLPQYGWFGVDRRGAHEDEHMGLFYDRERLTLVDLGNFWLSDTPDVVGSNSWGTPLPRMVTWGLFEDKETGKRFYLYNTHFPYKAEDEPAREKAAAVIVKRIAALPAEVPVIVTGDFNTTPDSRAHATLTGGLADVREEVSDPAGSAETFHNFTGKADRRIDWILERGFTPLHFATDTYHRDGHYPSDHFPVIADLRFD